MCGIFGSIGINKINKKKFYQIALHARQRGRDSSGLIYYDSNKYKVNRADYDIKQLLEKESNLETNVIMGHSRLITNGLSDNQPVVKDGICVIHNGIIVNDQEIWDSLDLQRNFNSKFFLSGHSRAQFWIPSPKWGSWYDRMSQMFMVQMFMVHRMNQM